ncbi:BnaA10g10650D [Brassica napus]|uniref:(rape) hypothetical protein n=1 Tax=Brassica napus TaxID=3708 RepID=A0A078H5P2_BRANA|nr:unnamed protein product [Brassica napus]CDY32784.1 BnaA10g10650D [Brassica napus]
MTCLYLLVKILAHIPTKDVVATSLLFKRWEFLWTYMKRLEYDQEYQFGNQIMNTFLGFYQRLFIRTVTKKDNGLRYSPHEKPIPKVMINAPCLKYLNIDDRGNDFNVIKDLTQVVEATINAKQTSTKVFLMYLTSSIKRLLLYSLRLEVIIHHSIGPSYRLFKPLAP